MARSVLTGVVLAAACRGGSSPRWSEGEVDGVRTVTTLRPLWAGVRALSFTVEATFASVPEASVPLSSVAGAASLSTGGVVVLDRTAAQAVEYGPDGSVQRVLGRRGAGPGELLGVTTLAVLPGDTIVVYDARRGRLTRFGPDEDRGQPESLDPELFPVAPVALWAAPAGELIAFEGNRRTGEVLKRVDDGAIFRAKAVLRAVHPARHVADTLWSGGVASEMLMRGDRLLTLPFGRSTYADVADGVRAVAASDAFRVDLFRDGERRSSVMPSAERELEMGEVERLRDSVRALAAAEAAPFLAEPGFREELQPERWPRFSAVRAAPDGRILARTFEPLGRRSAVWWVIDGRGVFLGRVSLPEGSDILEIDGDEWLILRRDALDVPSVQRVVVDRSVLMGVDVGPP